MGRLCALFSVFGVEHIVYLIAMIGIVVVLSVLLRNTTKPVKKWLNIALLCVAGLFTILDVVGRLIAGGKFFDNLPIEPYHIFFYICVYMFVKNSESWTKFGFLIIVPLLTISLFNPPLSLTGFESLSLPVISFFMINCAVLSFVILRLLATDFYLHTKDVISSLVNFVIIIGFVHIFNVFIRFTTLGVHSNAFGTMGESYDSWIDIVCRANFLNVPFICVIPNLIILTGISFAIFGVFNFIKTRKDRKAQLEELSALGSLKAQAKEREMKHPNGSQILIKGEKPRPETPKDVNNKVTGGGFVRVNKEVKVNNEGRNKKDS